MFLGNLFFLLLFFYLFFLMKSKPKIPVIKTQNIYKSIPLKNILNYFLNFIVF